MSIYITGDCHGDFSRFSPENFPEQQKMNKDDCVIICGDAGCLFVRNEAYMARLRWLSDRPFTTLFVDGNHENFDVLGGLPVRMWNGGKAHLLTSSVVHLMRGQVFELAGRTFFTFGGARSQDIRDGVLEPDDPQLAEKIRALKARSARFRINHISWWKEETPTGDEFREGVRNLDRVQRRVDFIVSHTGPFSVVSRLAPVVPGDLEKYLDAIKQECTYTHWYFGHFHADARLGDRESVLYRKILRIV